MIQFKNVSKKFGDVQVLQDVSFEVREGEIVGFLGPNGAGKTTTLRILSGFFPPTSGQVLISGIDLFKHPQKAKRHLGYLPEYVNLYSDMCVHEYLRFVAQLKGVPGHEQESHILNKMALCGLNEVRHRLISRLSKGYRQRIGIAQALVGDPPVLVLDEPTAGLDPQQVSQIRELVRAIAHNRAVIFSTHILPEVSILCTRVLMMIHGQILASGSVKELESLLKYRELIHVMIKDRKDLSLTLELLRSLPGVEAIHTAENEAGETILSFETTEEEDLRPRISRLLVGNGIGLTEIQRVPCTLEDIFLEILEHGISKEISGGNRILQYPRLEGNKKPQSGEPS